MEFYSEYFFLITVHGSGTHYTVDSGTPTEPPTRKPYVETRNSTYHGIGPREEARAMCSVRTQEVNATANATITRRLHGVVTSSEYRLVLLLLTYLISYNVGNHKTAAYLPRTLLANLFTTNACSHPGHSSTIIFSTNSRSSLA